MFAHNQEKPSPESYDQIPYPSYPYTQTHPDHLAALGILSGMAPAPVDRCRVLELGCASGGNLIPMAYTLPESEFIGIDFSGNAIAGARATVSDLNLKNVRFIHQDFLSIDRSIGQFDFIIAHGIFSWVPPDVQEKLLKICREQMTPEGIAYLSYNVYPGWHIFQIVRDLMLFRIGGATGDAQKVKEVRNLIHYLSDSLSDSGGLLPPVLTSVQKLLNDAEDGYIRHDFLEEVNEPVYFADFIMKAKAHGLKFLANGELSAPKKLPEEVVEKVLEEIEDEIEVEQYLDFLRNRTYRETLLCQKEQIISPASDPRGLSQILVSSRVRPDQGDFDITSTDALEFTEPQGLRLSTSHPLTKAALTYLKSIWPLAVPYQTLLAESWQVLGSEMDNELDPYSGANEIEVLASNLLILHAESVDLIRFHTYQPDLVLEISEYPCASATARYQAKNKRHITNLYHQRVTMDQFPRHLVHYLDGHHNHHDLLLVTFDAVKKGILEVDVDGKPVQDPMLVQDSLADLLSGQLQQMAQAALLVG
jgi:methyltransferase-like protein